MSQTAHTNRVAVHTAGRRPCAIVDCRWQSIIAVGRQDVDPDDLTSPGGTSIVGVDSDHLLVPAASPLADASSAEPADRTSAT